MAGLPQECGLCDSHWFTLVVTQVVSQSQVRHFPGQICSPPMERASNPIRKQLVTLRGCCVIVPMGISCQIVSDVVWRAVIINDPIPPPACIALPALWHSSAGIFIAWSLCVLYPEHMSSAAGSFLYSFTGHPGTLATACIALGASEVAWPTAKRDLPPHSIF